MKGNQDRRIARLEQRSRSGNELFYLAWGRTDDEIEDALADAGLLDGDTVVRGVWPNAGALPPSRSIEDTWGALSREEDDALHDILERRVMAHTTAAEREAADAERGGGADSRCAHLSDVALISLALGEAWGAGRGMGATLTDWLKGK
jgi:hypothetical protein